MKCAGRQLEVDCLNKMRVFERVPCEGAKAGMRKEPIKVRWVDTWKGSVMHRSTHVATEFGRGSKYEGFANLSATPPLELVKLIISLLATEQRDPESWFGWRERGGNDQVAMMHTDISVVHTFMFRATKKTLNCHQKCGSLDTLRQIGWMRVPKF